ncbi:FAD-dependent oxidoreductase [Leclercia sp. S52]|uniref:FAD-binding oxidoreductase n=1 Tax=Leclercia sp. S52 TaxID=3138178 RepID=UPI00321929DF
MRQIWNAMIDRKPALIARCTSTEDVIRAIQFGRTQNLLISIRGGGHNIAGNAVCDDGLMIDLSLMKDVQVDLTTRTASVGPGCTLGDFDQVVQAHGLATPLGINSTTGVAGLTLGGGFGWLSRKYGMTIDNLLSAEVITADGQQLNASESENADLFWGLRGGGGNFGVVTRFDFQLHPVGPNVLSGLIVFPFEQAKSVISQFARFTETMPEELNVWMVTRKAPPLPFLPAEVHGREMIALALCYVGDPEEGGKAYRAATRVRHGAGRARRRATLYGLAAGLRSAAGERGAQLLEVAQLCANQRRRDRSHHRIRGQAAVPAL